MRWMSTAAGTMLALGLLARPAAAQLQPQPGDVTLHDYAFQDGERLPELRLHYTTLGTPQRDGGGRITNAVLLLHGTGGTGASFLQPDLANPLFGPGQPLDAAHHYIVLPDGIGAGGSSRPSDGLHAHFPHYGYVDQVEAQHALLAALGIEHLQLVSGLSQGGMQTWLWGERYPDAADRLVPLACMPMQISGRNLMWRQVGIHAIQDDPGYRGGDYDPAHPPTAWAEVVGPLFTLMVSTPERLQEAGPDRARTLAYDASLIGRQEARDPNNDLYDLESSSDYDPAPDIGRIRAPMLAINFADDQVNPASLPVTAQTIARIPSARFVLLPGGYGHGSIYHAELWGPTLARFLGD